MNLVKTSFYTGISTAVSFISGFIVTKVVAVKIGPAGMAYVGQYQNTIAILAMLSTAAIAVGVIKYLATYKDDAALRQKVITTAIIIVLLCSVGTALFTLIFSGYLSESAFHSTEYRSVYLLYSLFITIISLNSLFVAFFNGWKKIKQLTIINISSSLAGVACTVIFAYWMGVKGVLIASNFAALIVFFISISFLRKEKEFTWKINFASYDRKIAVKLVAFTVMNLVTGFLAPAVQFFIRNKIIKDFSADEAGHWQAVTRISDYYLSFFTTVLSVYYLPRLAEITDRKELRNEIARGYKLILPVVGIVALSVWLGRDLIVHILFTPKFLAMMPLFKFQLIGDFLKIGSWLLAFIMVSKAMTRTFIATEIIFSCSLVTASYFFINWYGVIGATYAFALNYLLYWGTMWFLMKRHLR